MDVDDTGNNSTPLLLLVEVELATVANNRTSTKLKETTKVIPQDYSNSAFFLNITILRRGRAAPRPMY